MTVLAVLTFLENTLPSFSWSNKIQDKEAAVTVLTVLAVLAVVAVSVVTATPLKLNPLFCHPDCSSFPLLFAPPLAPIASARGQKENTKHTHIKCCFAPPSGCRSIPASLIKPS